MKLVKCRGLLSNSLYLSFFFLASEWTESLNQQFFLSYLQLGPLNAANAARGIAPGQFGAKDELRLSQFVGAAVVHLRLDLPKAVSVGGGVQAFDGGVVLLHKLVGFFQQLLLAAVVPGEVVFCAGNH